MSYLWLMMNETHVRHCSWSSLFLQARAPQNGRTPRNVCVHLVLSCTTVTLSLSPWVLYGSFYCLKDPVIWPLPTCLNPELPVLLKLSFFFLSFPIMSFFPNVFRVLSVFTVSVGVRSAASRSFYADEPFKFGLNQYGFRPSSNGFLMNGFMCQLKGYCRS